WGPVFYNLFVELGFNDDQETDHTGYFPDRVFDAKDLVGILIDYMDSDDESFIETSYARGLESQAPEELFANDRITSVDELINLPGFTPARLKQLLPLLTTAGRTMVNVNAAPKEIIKALHEDITDQMVQEVIDYRKEKPFSRDLGSDSYWKQELLRIFGDDIYNEIQTLVGIESRYFDVIAKVDYGGNARYFLRALLFEDPALKDEPPVIQSLELF
ncbi:MAG: general secretion pathway protein GspK, partial [Bdellovibrionales bacterium]|nr:general secretion pathway protein GspK [Bdellovibrionales bacterium]